VDLREDMVPQGRFCTVAKSQSDAGGWDSAIGNDA
jgi:hypothetical protein